MEFRRYGYTAATNISGDLMYRLRQLAAKHNVTVSAYLRALIVDAVYEEGNPPGNAPIGERCSGFAKEDGP